MSGGMSGGTGVRLGLAFILGASVAGCTGAKPSREDCDAFIEKYGEMLASIEDKEGRTVKKLALKQREYLLQQCVSRGTKAEVECAMKQDSFDDIAKNCK